MSIEKAPPPAYSPSPNSEGVNIEQEADLLIASFLPTECTSAPPEYRQRAQLPAPLCLPQTSSKPDSPFLRGHAAILSTVGVQRSAWLNFLDGLNLVISESDHFRNTNAVGGALCMVPIIGLAGLAIKATAHHTNAAHTKPLIDRYIGVANEHLFGPLGLCVQLVKTPVLQRLTGQRSAAAGPTKAAAIGRKAANVWMRLPIPLVVPIGSALIRAGVGYADKKGKAKEGAAGQPSLENVGGPVIIQDPSSPIVVPPKTIAHLESFRGYILPVEVNVPEPSSPKGMLDKWNRFIVANDMKMKEAEWKFQEQHRHTIGDKDKELRRKWQADDTLWVVLAKKERGASPQHPSGDQAIAPFPHEDATNVIKRRDSKGCE